MCVRVCVLSIRNQRQHKSLLIAITNKQASSQHVKQQSNKNRMFEIRYDLLINNKTFAFFFFFFLFISSISKASQCEVLLLLDLPACLLRLSALFQGEAREKKERNSQFHAKKLK